MFETLSDRLGGIFDKLTRRGALSEADVDAAMREVRRALIEADVALEVVRGFIDRVKAEAVGQDVVKMGVGDDDIGDGLTGDAHGFKLVYQGGRWLVTRNLQSGWNVGLIIVDGIDEEGTAVAHNQE